MKTKGSTTELETEDRCDSRIWSGSCEHDDFIGEGEKYLCDFCGKIAILDHQVNHVGFPHVSGDYDKLY